MIAARDQRVRYCALRRCGAGSTCRPFDAGAVGPSEDLSSGSSGGSRWRTTDRGRAASRIEDKLRATVAGAPITIRESLTPESCVPVLTMVPEIIDMAFQ